MDIRITFQGMPHSDPIEAHIREKLQKIDDVRGNDPEPEPYFIEFKLEAHKTHPHHRAGVYLKTPRFSLDTHHEDADMYWAIDHAIDRMVELLKKEKARTADREHKPETEKKEFGEDKYTLGED